MTPSQKKLLLFSGFNKNAIFNKILSFLNNGLVAYWPFDEVVGSFARVINPAVSLGRNICINGTFAADASWTKGSGWTITGGVAVATSVLAGATLSQSSPTIPLVLGRSYSVTYDLTISGGSVKVQIGTGGNGTTRSTNGTYTETIVCTTTSQILFNAVTTFTGTIDNVTVKEVNIPASSFGVQGGLNLVLNSSFNNWTASTPDSWTPSTTTANAEVQQVGSGASHGGGGTGSMNIWTNNNTNVSLSQSGILTAGKRYMVVMNFSAFSGNLALQNFNGTSNYLVMTSGGQKIAIFTAIDTGIKFVKNGNIDATLDDMTIIETDDMTGVNTGITINQPSGKLNKSYSFNGSTSLVNIYSTALNSAINPDEGSISIFCQVADLATWTDGTSRNSFRLSADGSNIINNNKGTGDRAVNYIAGGTTKTATLVSTTLDWYHVVITWSKSLDQVKYYINGIQSGSTQTGLGQWVGNLSATLTTIGAANNTPTGAWKGKLAHMAIFNRPLTAAEILSIAQKAGLA